MLFSNTLLNYLRFWDISRSKIYISISCLQLFYSTFFKFRTDICKTYLITFLLCIFFYLLNGIQGHLYWVAYYTHLKIGSYSNDVYEFLKIHVFEGALSIKNNITLTELLVTVNFAILNRTPCIILHVCFPLWILE